MILGVAISVALALLLWFLQGQRSGIRRNGKRLPYVAVTLESCLDDAIMILVLI